MIAVEHITLPNCRRVRIRPLRPCEETPIRELYAHLTPRTRYLRFFSSMPALPDVVAQQLAWVDGRTRVALVAEDAAARPPEPIGLASFGAVDETAVELALVVRDDWQNQRLGTELAMRILDAAEACGFHRFVASIQGHNTAIRALLRRIGRVVSASFDSGISEVAFVRQRDDRVAPPDPPNRTLTGR